MQVVAAAAEAEAAEAEAAAAAESCVGDLACQASALTAGEEEASHRAFAQQSALRVG